MQKNDHKELFLKTKTTAIQISWIKEKEPGMQSIHEQKDSTNNWLIMILFVKPEKKER